MSLLGNLFNDVNKSNFLTNPLALIGTGLLAQSGPSRLPTSLGQALGKSVFSAIPILQKQAEAKQKQSNLDRRFGLDEKRFKLEGERFDFNKSYKNKSFEETVRQFGLKHALEQQKLASIDRARRAIAGSRGNGLSLNKLKSGVYGSALRTILKGGELSPIQKKAIELFKPPNPTDAIINQKLNENSGLPSFIK